MFTPEVITAFLVCMGAAAATVLGGLIVIYTRVPQPRLLAFGLSFAGGAMIYISLVEILVKSQLAFGQVWAPKPAYIAATLAFFAGVFLLVILDRLIPNPHAGLAVKHQEPARIKHLGLLTMLAITAHNVPEGMATFFATLDNPSIGLALAFAIAVHNIPEGISIAVPVYVATGSRIKTLAATTISAVAEPLGALLGYAVLAPFLSPAVYGSVFGVIAGAMVYLSLDELLPTAKRYAKGHETIYGIISGMGLIALSLVLFK